VQPPTHPSARPHSPLCVMCMLIGGSVSQVSLGKKRPVDCLMWKQKLAAHWKHNKAVKLRHSMVMAKVLSGQRTVQHPSACACTPSPTYELRHDIRPIQHKQDRARVCGSCPCKYSLPAAWRPVEQYTSGWFK
jgi:hypothetical protein